jgi:hypothetical protein
MYGCTGFLTPTRRQEIQVDVLMTNRVRRKLPNLAGFFADHRVALLATEGLRKNFQVRNRPITAETS